MQFLKSYTDFIEFILQKQDVIFTSCS